MSIVASARLQPLTNLLSMDGFRPIVREGLIAVKVEGGEYLVATDTVDSDFYQLIYPNLWVMPNADSSLRILQACNVASSNSKFAKMQIYGDSVHCVVQALHPGGDDHFYEHFARYISAIKFASNIFLENIREKA